MGPPRRRGRAPLAAPVCAEVAAVQRRFPEFGLKRVRDFLRRFAGLTVSVGSVRKVRRLAAECVVALRSRVRTTLCEFGLARRHVGRRPRSGPIPTPFLPRQKQ
jgi:hypothetical protein